MKILYVAPLGIADTSTHRMWAIKRLGQEVVPFDTRPYVYAGGRIITRIRHLFPVSVLVNRFNRDLLTAAFSEKVDLVWSDKQTILHPATLSELNAHNIDSLDYCIDNPFGTSNHGGWRLFLKCIPGFSFHVVQRSRSVEEFRQNGARAVVKIQTAFEPTLHYPPPDAWSDSDCCRDVSFIGSPYDDRPEFLTRLWKEFSIPLAISGSARWKRLLSADAFNRLYRGGELHGADYRQGIWKSKISLSFLTHCNLDEFAHKSFEIAGCGSFLLAERSAGHLERFIEDEEAVFFSSLQECAEKIGKYLPDETARRRIAASGRRRAIRSGYDNDTQMKIVLDAVANYKAGLGDCDLSKKAEK